MPGDSQADVIVIGAGLSGLVAATELCLQNKKVVLIDQEGPQNLGGQAFWSFGGLFLVDSPEQRRMGIRDSYALAWDDWMGSAGFDRKDDLWPKKWAEAYLAFAAGEKRSWLQEAGLSWFPVVGWAERGGYGLGHGNSVPRFHVTWGTGTGVVKPFVERAREAEKKGNLRFLFRHRVDEILMQGGSVSGVRGKKLAEANEARGVPSNRKETGDFEVFGAAVVIASGGIGANHELVRKNWPERLGKAPKVMVQGVPDYVDGRMIGIGEAAGGNLINRDRMWHYTEGLQNWNPVWTKHGIRILPGPSSIWLDARGRRLPAPYFPGFDTLGTLDHIMKTGYEYSWFILNQSIIKKEFALSGSEQNPDLTNRDYRLLAGRVLGKKAAGPVEAFKSKGADFIVRENLDELLLAMNALTGEPRLDLEHVKWEINARDRQLDNEFGKDLQIAAIRQARKYRGDKLVRTAKLGKILDPRNGPLIAVRLNILTRKTLGGFETDLSARVLQKNGEPLPGLYAVGEAAGFGGGGMHGYRALEGSFLGGCLFSGRNAGRALAKEV